jgi:hypothetical protein
MDKNFAVNTLMGVTHFDAGLIPGGKVRAVNMTGTKGFYFLRLAENRESMKKLSQCGLFARTGFTCKKHLFHTSFHYQDNSNRKKSQALFTVLLTEFLRKLSLTKIPL